MQRLYRSRVPHREEKEYNKESGRRGYEDRRCRRGRIMATIRARTQRLYRSRVPQKEEKGDNKESGRRGSTDQGYRRGGRRATINTADTEAIQIKSTAEGGDGRQ